MGILDFLGLGGSDEPDMWVVAYDVDDYDGPEWYAGAGVDDQYGPYDTQDDAVAAAKHHASIGDEIKVWGKGAEEPTIYVLKTRK